MRLRKANWERLKEYVDSQAPSLVSAEQAAEALKWKLQQVYDAQRVAKHRHGVEIPTLTNRVRRAAKNAIKSNPARPRASVRDLVKSLPPEVALWLMEQVPTGAAISDVVRSIIIDAFYAEHEASNSNRNSNLKR